MGMNLFKRIYFSGTLCANQFVYFFSLAIASSSEETVSVYLDQEEEANSHELIYERFFKEIAIYVTCWEAVHEIMSKFFVIIIVYFLFVTTPKIMAT